jgi:protein-S-isoprenylcysteine O-methyltransferase Ste14
MLLLVPLALVLLDVVQVQREERYLLRKFGNEYAAYQKRVRRWL